VDLISSWEWKEVVKKDVELKENQATEIVEMACPCPPGSDQELESKGERWSMTTSWSVVVGVRLVDAENGEVIARFVDWPQPYRFLDEEVRGVDPGLSFSISPSNEDDGGDEATVTILTRKPVKCLVLDTPMPANGTPLGGKDDAKFDENGIDLMPDDPRVVKVKGLKGRGLVCAYFGKEKMSAMEINVV
jgi:beta-mannosidase